VREQGWRSLALGGAFFGVAAIVGQATRHWAPGFASAVLLFAVSWRFWLPVDFELDALGITQRIGGRCWRFRWSAIGGYEPLAEGARLWPAGASPLTAAARALIIPWDGQREAVLAILAENLGPLHSVAGSLAPRQ
jgi:hypothetical protein